MTFTLSRPARVLLLALLALAAVPAAAETPLRPGEAPAALSARAVEFFQLVQERQWPEAAELVSQQSRDLFTIPDDAVPEVVLTHLTFNPGRILQLAPTTESWYHLAPHQEADGLDLGPTGSAIYRMEILLQDADYYPELTLLWIHENQRWRLLCDDIYQRYLALRIPGDGRGLCTRFMSQLRHGQWEEAASMVSARSAALPFSPPVTEPKARVHSLTFVPGKNTFKEFVYIPDGDSWCEIEQYNEAQGWFEMQLNRLAGSEPRLSLIWVREDGDWKVYCDADYLLYLDLSPPDRMPPALLETVERYHINVCRGFNRKWWDVWGDKYLWNAYNLGSEKLRARTPFKEFAAFPDPLPVPRFVITYQRVAGFSRLENGLVEVVVFLKGGGPGARLEAPATAQWIEINGAWRRTTAEAEFIGK